MAAPVTTETNIRENLSTIGQRIAAAVKAAASATNEATDLEPPSVTLIAISKAHPAAAAKKMGI